VKKLARGGGVVALTAIALTACGSSPGPEGTAASTLAASGAKANGNAYMVPANVTYASCDAGSAEADGTLGKATVAVCVFPNKAQHDQDEATAVEAGSDNPTATITAGDLTLVYVTGASKAMLNQIASAVNGTVVVP
jgi:hypothetical protein